MKWKTFRTRGEEKVSQKFYEIYRGKDFVIRLKNVTLQPQRRRKIRKYFPGFLLQIFPLSFLIYSAEINKTLIFKAVKIMIVLVNGSI
ncbi:MAG: hypothetical protein EGR33_04000 [Prevotella sp.]|nr:hypothetical protein [Prevotella sp.]